MLVLAVTTKTEWNKKIVNRETRINIVGNRALICHVAVNCQVLGVPNQIRQVENRMTC